MLAVQSAESVVEIGHHLFELSHRFGINEHFPLCGQSMLNHGIE